MARRANDTPLLFELERPEEPRERTGFFVEVALNRPVRREFTYAVPDELRPRIAAGVRVAVPFAGARRHVGVVVGTRRKTDVPARRMRSVLDVLDDEPIVGAELLGLTRWIARRYAASWGEALAAVLPAPLKRERGLRQVVQIEVAPGVGPAQLLEIEERFPKQHRLLRTLLEIGAPVELRALLRQLQLSDSPATSLARRGWVRLERVDARPDVLLGGRTDRGRPERLSDEQAGALARVEAALAAGEHRTFLVHGVTGSGKTELYLCAIEAALARGRTAIVLVPEIALTPQTVSWFRSRFGAVAVMHSGLTDAQRFEMWRRLKHGEARVVVGARSAIFAPLERLGVVVVDEEHEPSFKQGSVPRYHARDVAVERARRAGAVCLLGSATPSLESWHAAETGRYERLRLTRRVGGGSVPPIELVDLKAERVRGQTPLFSRTLRYRLAETVESGEQAILFLNRRGFTPVLYCPGCEATVRCEQCDVSMTLHRRIGRLVCHACCEERRVPAACPSCTRPGLRPLGAGSQRVEHELGHLLPGVRVRRMDSDTMRRREDYEEVLDAFGRHEFDVLVGTQMIAKGLDFPRVTLVGILHADQSLHVKDFRAGERTFQLISQVAGRAGRGTRPGRIVLQTQLPDSAEVRHAVAGDYEAYARWELAQRRTLGFPPFARSLRVLVEDEVEARADETIRACAACVAGLSRRGWRATEPRPAPIAMLRNRHRRDLVVHIPGGDDEIEHAAAALADLAAKQSRSRVTVDVDPVSMF